MTNAQSIVNKLEEADIVFEQQQVDIGIITESWFSSKIPENYVNIPGYNLYSKPRGQKGGGGVAAYVHEDVPAIVMDKITVPPELECMWLKVRPKKLHRKISAIAICPVYITTKSPYQNLLAENLLDTVDCLRAKYPDIGVMITGDFNRINLNHLCRGNDLYQIIDFPTRANATLDLIITSGKLKDHYRKPFPLSPFGKSDHVCVIWKSNLHRNSGKNTIKAETTRPLSESGINSFGTWIQSLDRHEVLESNATQDKAECFLRHT